MLTIKEIEVENFRSIIKPMKINPSNYTVVVGPNNSGKSNLFRALELFFKSTVNGQPFNVNTDFPKYNRISNNASTKITIEFEYEPKRDTKITNALFDMEKNSQQKRLDNNRLRLRLSYSRKGNVSWQFIGKAGARNVRQELIDRIVEATITSVKFKYLPVGRDISSVIQTEISQELVQTIFSGWSGTSVRVKQEINTAINDLFSKLNPQLTESSVNITNSLNRVFKEIQNLELKLPFHNLETMLPILIPVLTDSYETPLDAKGAGIQTSSLLFFLKYLADNQPMRYNATVTYIWAIEEPESYLHPKRQRGVSDILRTFSEDVQTFITTHSPHFVPKDHKSKAYVIEKEESDSFSTVIIGTEYELARQSLGVTLLDSMYLNEINIIVEGESDVILFGDALLKLHEAGQTSINPEKVKFFPANSCNAACILYESFFEFGNTDEVRLLLLIDGDEAGKKALHGMVQRLSTNGIKIKANKDYFILPSIAEGLTSKRVKEVLIKERPAQVKYLRNTKDQIISFVIAEGYKKKVANRIIEISTLRDLSGYKKVINMIENAIF